MLGIFCYSCSRFCIFTIYSLFIHLSIFIHYIIFNQLVYHLLIIHLFVDFHNLLNWRGATMQSGGATQAHSNLDDDKQS